MKLIYTTTAIAAFSAGAVSAQQLTYGDFSADYSYTDNGLFEQDIWNLRGAAELTFGQVLLSGEFRNLSRRTSSLEIDATNYAFGAGYIFTPFILAGGGVTGYANHNNSAADYNGLEVYAQYQTPQFGIAINHSQRDLDLDSTTTTFYGILKPATGVELVAKIRTYTNSSGSIFEGLIDYYLSAQYEDGPYAIRGSVNGYNEIDGARIWTRGTAEVTPDVRLLASYSTSYGDFIQDLTSFSAGAGVQVAPDVWVDTTFGMVTGDSLATDFEFISLGINFEFGNRARIDDSIEKDVFDDSADLRKLVIPIFLP